MKILLIKPKHIGDALLMTPLIHSIKAVYPQSLLWVLVRKGSEGILAGCPQIDRVLTTVAPEKKLRTKVDFLASFTLIRTLRKQCFDYIFDLSGTDRARWIATLSRAVHRITPPPCGRWSGLWKKIFSIPINQPRRGHVVEQDYHLASSILKLPQKIPPLVFDRALRTPVNLPIEGSYFVVNPTSRWKRKQWDPPKWISLCQKLLQKVDFIVLSVGPDPEEQAFGDQITQKLDSQRVFSTKGRYAFRELASIIASSVAFIGVDTVVMHLAAACQTPVVAILGPTDECHWHPWETPALLIKARVLKGLENIPIQEVPINAITVDYAWDKMETWLQTYSPQ